MDEQATPATEPDRYSWPKRALLLVLGGAAAVVGAGVAILWVGLFVHAVLHDGLTGRPLIEAGFLTFAAVLAFGSLGAMGVERSSCR